MENKRNKIIIVDDDITCLNIAKNALIDQYDVFTVPSGKKLFQILEKLTPELIMLDVEMPEMGGYEIIKKLKSNKETAQIPVLFLTAILTPESELEGLSLGAIDYITKPISQPLLKKRVEVHLLIETQKKELEKYNDNLEQMVKEKTKTVFDLQNAVLKTVAELVECRDNVTGSHIERTQNYLRVLVSSMLEQGVYRKELSLLDIDLFILSSQLHDVGKISIKDKILLKPAKLTDEELEEMKKHTIFGVNIIKKIEESTKESMFLKHAEIMAGTHHEKWDGTGYPYGLKGEEIPLQGRLMAIVDVYDALTNDRPYKEAFTHERAVEIIGSESGTHFDPRIVEVFLKDNQKLKHCEFTGDSLNSMPGNRSEIVSELQNTVAHIVDHRGYRANGHTDRMRKHLKIFINALLEDEHYKDRVSAWDMDIFLLSAQLHDVGKIAVKDYILNKPEKLTEEEYENVKSHADFGVKVIKKIKDDINESSLLDHAEALAGSHHEQWNGTGYPDGLKGEDIPIQGRLMAIVDVYDALTNDRPYKDAISHEKAVEIIKNGSGTNFDPRLVDIFLRHEKEFEEN